MKRKGSPMSPACLSEGDVIILPDGRKAVVTGRPTDRSCTYRTDKGEEGTIDRCSIEAYDRRYGYVDPKTKSFTNDDIWFSKSIAIIDTPECCIFCPFSESNGKGTSYCTLLWAKQRETGNYGNITVHDTSIKDLTKEKMEEAWHYRDPRCPLTDLKPYQTRKRADAVMDFIDGLEHEEFKYIKRGEVMQDNDSCGAES